MRYRSDKVVPTTVDNCEARGGLFKCQERPRKQFSPLWRSCEARASPFKGQEGSGKQFSPPLRSCEARQDCLSAW